MNKIFISVGDVNGIGIEIIQKALKQYGIEKDIIVIVGNLNIFEEYTKLLGMDYFSINVVGNSFGDVKLEDLKPRFLNFVDLNEGFKNLKLKFGTIDKLAGKLAGESIKAAVLCAKKFGGSIVTAPINKESLNLGGFHYQGHTEFIAELLGEKRFLMILDGGVIKTALVTTHLPFKDIPAAITEEKIYEMAGILLNSLKVDYGIKKPRISICALNCHASDGGLFGDEEEKVIIPAVKKLKANLGDYFIGPLPADTLFTKSFLKKTDAYLVMYHDQGLIPLKLLSFGEGVNFTSGLSIVRTSPDHGTAFDIAGKCIADCTSFLEALEKGSLFIKNREKDDLNDI